ncbi:MAG: LysM peptidoglycan-binding domain-containing protein [Sulfuritalea sp.]|nr:LysM peptidoglycan-binding domain-containing protein [Sulfuritalea sp.]
MEQSRWIWPTGRRTGMSLSPGDTLWSIASKFLKDPYRWGDLWKLNAEEIRNPQRIYPGQVISLDKSGNQPRVRLVTVREQRREYVEPLRKPIPSIPPQEIEPFLSEPRVLDKAGLDAAPRIVGVQDNRVIAGAGDTIFATEVTAGRAGPDFSRGGGGVPPPPPPAPAPATQDLAIIPPGQAACRSRHQGDAGPGSLLPRHCAPDPGQACHRAS